MQLFLHEGRLLATAAVKESIAMILRILAWAFLFSKQR